MSKSYTAPTATASSTTSTGVSPADNCGVNCNWGFGVGLVICAIAA